MLVGDMLDDFLRIEIADVCNVLAHQIEDVYECTPIQLGMFAESAKCDGAYQTLSVSSLDASIDEECFCSALRQVYRANAVLRTRIVECSRGLVQAVIDEDLDIQKPTHGLEHHLQRERNRHMWLGTPLSTVAIVEHNDSALQLFMSDVTRAYLNEPALQRAAFKEHVRMCSGIDNAAARDFWISQLQNEAVPFPPVRDGETVSATAMISSTLAIAQTGSSVPVALLPSYVEAAWALTSASYTGGDCVTFGNVLSGRTPSSDGLEATLGPTIAVVPLQVMLRPNMTVEQLIRDRTEARRRLLASSALHYGLAKISKVSVEAKIACQFQTVLNIRRREGENLFSVLGTTLDYVHDAPQPYALSLQCTINVAEIHVEARYDIKVLPDKQMQRVLQQFQHFLRLLMRAPLKLELAQIPRLSPKDRQQLLQWNKSVSASIHQPLHELFSERARSLPPETHAVEAPDGTLNYAELEDFSDRLACQLQRHGVSAGSAVILHSEKSKWAIIGVVATLKAGAACVPLMPDHPRLHKELVISNTRASVLLTSRRYFLECADMASKVLVVDQDAVEILHDLRPVDISLSPHQPAYILYTSGSTGTPKGVVLQHCNLTTSIMAYAERLGLAKVAKPKVLQFAALVWDSSIAEIWMALLLGGTICMPSETEREASLAEYVNSHHIDWMSLTPSMLRTFSPDDFPNLRFLCSVGEPIDPSASNLWGSHNVGRLLPVGAVGELIVDGPGVAQCYLEDEERTAAAFVQPPPWAPRRARSHMYRTGDLARYEADDSLSFIGRQDHQVKVRGQRFDLSEVERALAEHANVHEVVAVLHSKTLIAVVSLTEDDSGDCKALDLVPPDVARPHLKPIMDGAQRRLPSYMLPSAYLLVRRLPLSQSDKIDRAAITNWISTQGTHAVRAEMSLLTDTSSSPSTPHERLLQEIWGSVLDVPIKEVGTQSSFIGLGGDSITGMQVVSRCRKQGVSLKMSDMLRSKSLIEAAKHCSLVSEAPCTPPIGSTDYAPPLHDAARVMKEAGLGGTRVQNAYACTPMQEGVLFSQARGEEGDYVASFAVKATGPSREVLDTTRLIDAWYDVCKTFSILRTVCCSTSTDKGFQQLVLHEPPLWTAIKTPQADFKTVFGSWKAPVFQLSRPRHRLSIVRCPPGETYIVLDIDHVLYDAVSIKLMMAALTEAYSSGTTVTRHGLEFVDYVAWAQHHREIAKQYWKSYLSGATPCLVPISLARTASNERPTTLKVAVPYSDAARPAQLCMDHNFTIAHIAQAAWSMVLQLLTGRPRVCFGFLYSGRDVFDGADQIVGPMILMLTCQAKITSQTTVQGLLRGLQQDLGYALQHSACSLGDVQDSFSLNGPLFNTSMSVQHVPQELDVTSDGLKIQTIAGRLTTEYPISSNVYHSRDFFCAELTCRSADVSDSFATYIAEVMSSAVTVIVDNSQGRVASFALETTQRMFAPWPFSLISQEEAETLRYHAASQCETSPRLIEDVFPCSPVQKEKYLSTLQHGIDLSIPHVFRLRTDADVDELRKAWDSVHLAIPALRTRVLEEANFQAIVAVKPAWTECDDLAAYLAWNKGVRVRYGRPLSRLGLVEQPDGSSYIVWSVHAGIADQYTIGLVLNAVENAYMSETVTLFRSASIFVDYLVMRNVAAGAFNYWREKLERLGEANSFPPEVQNDHPTLFLCTDSRKINTPLSKATNSHSLLCYGQHGHSVFLDDAVNH